MCLDHLRFVSRFVSRTNGPQQNKDIACKQMGIPEEDFTCQRAWMREKNLNQIEETTFLLKNRLILHLLNFFSITS